MQDPVFLSTQFPNAIVPIPMLGNAVRKRYPLDAPLENPMKSYYEHIFPNQTEFGKKIVQLFQNEALLNVLALAPTQSGKTGSMVAVIYEFLQSPTIQVPKENVFLFTGLSSCDWVKQTSARFPPWMRNQIYHRNKLDRLIEELKDKKNVLLIIDEAHIASSKNQSIMRLYEHLKLYDLANLYHNNIKLVQFTATPDHLETTLPKLFGDNAHATQHMRVPHNYISAQKLQSLSRVFQAKKLVDEDNPLVGLNHVRELKHIALRGNPAYHIIRTPRGIKHAQTIDVFKNVFANDNCIFISEPMSNTNLQTLLKNKPKCNSFIFIKDKLRCAQTIHHKWVRVLYDRCASKQKKHAILQGLWGRATGFYENDDINVWTNLHILINENVTNEAK